MLPKKKWLPIAGFVIIIQALLELLAFVTVNRLGMLPDKYLLVVSIILIAGVVVTAILLLAGIGHGRGNGRRIRRIIGLVLAAVLGIAGIAVSLFAYKVGQTVDSVTDTTDTPSAMIGVYVRNNDAAADITDMRTYTFGALSELDRDSTDQAVADINKKLSTSISIQEYGSMTEEGQALYDQQVDAIILNEAFADVLKDTEELKDFDTQTKLIYEIPIYGKANDSDTEGKDANGLNASSDETDNGGNGSITEHPFTVYVSGSDTRSKILDVSRSDVNILMTVNPKTKQILLLNTPRDYYVPNPHGGGELDKLTHLGLYGVETSMQGLEDLYDVDVDYYGQINFTGFEKLIDAIGGITVDSDTDFTSNEGFHYNKGLNELNGEQALAFARDRYHQATGDNARGRHEMVVIKAVIEKLTSGDSTILMNYSKILDELQGMISTNLKASDISALVKMQLNDGASWNIKSFAVTGKGGSEYTYSTPSSKAYVMYEDKGMVKYAASLIDKVENGDTLTDEDLKYTSTGEDDDSSTSDSGSVESDSGQSSDTSQNSGYVQPADTWQQPSDEGQYVEPSQEVQNNTWTDPGTDTGTTQEEENAAGTDNNMQDTGDASEYGDTQEDGSQTQDTGENGYTDDSQNAGGSEDSGYTENGEADNTYTEQDAQAQ